jgi:WD40 repeat protein
MLMKNFTHNLAIAIGINNYSKGIAELKTAKPDAEELIRLLSSSDYGYQPELITDDTERKPTLGGIRDLLKSLPQKLSTPAKNNRLLFYFAGHGMSLESDDGPRGFLLPQNADPKDTSTFLPMQELHDALIALPCHHLLIILDCCFAGTFRWSSTRKSIPIPETIHRQHYDRFIRYPACQVITSSAHNQTALDFLNDKRGISKKDAKHSPFAEALFEALQDGKPDRNGKRYKNADLTKDGVITAPELYLYLRDNVETRSGERQTPGLFPLKKHDRGEYIFHDPNFDSSTLSEAPELDEANNPYRGLKPFEEQHARFFFGRQELIEKLYTHIAKPDHSLTVVLGVSGSGKSSLVKAGLIPYLKKRSQPEEFTVHLAKACTLTTAILYSFARLPHKPWFPPKFLPIDYTHQWQILAPIRPGESPFASLARTLLAIAEVPASPQINQLNFLNDHLQREHKELKAQRNQAISQKQGNSKVKQLQEKLETFTQIVTDWKNDDLSIRQRSLVEHFEVLYALCSAEAQESEQQQQLKQAFLACLAPLIQQLQSDPESLVAIICTWQERHPDVQLLLIIDQFEELITLGRPNLQSSQTQQPEEWQQFLSLLEATLAANLPQLRIIVTLRSDFEPRFLSSEALKPYWSKARFPVRAMRSDELRQAIEGPASEMALYFEPVNLVDCLVDEVGQMPGALPLLSFTLSELYVQLAEKWRNQETSDRALTIDAKFEQEGGVAGSLTRRANEEYQKIGQAPDLGDAGQRTMRRVMLRMLTLEGGETARRRVPDSELIYPTQEESDRVKQVVNRLVNARLLVRGQLETGEPYVEPAHDFLIRGWGMLQDWINEEKENLILLYQLTSIAREWESSKSVGLLWDDSPYLPQLRQVFQQQDNWFNQIEYEFVSSSLRLSTLQLQIVEVLNLLPIAPVEALVMAIASTGLALPEFKSELIFNRVEASLMKAIDQSRECNQLRGHDGPITSVAINQQGDRIISAGKDSTIRLWNLEGSQINQPFVGHEGVVHAIAFHPDGYLVASGGSDGTVRLWDLNGRDQIFFCHQGNVLCIAISPDGQILASGGEDSKICLQNFNGTWLAEIEHPETVTSIAFSSDSQEIVSGCTDNTVRYWRISGEFIKEFKPNGNVGSSHHTYGSITDITFGTYGSVIFSKAMKLYPVRETLWFLSSGGIIRSVAAHNFFSYCVACSSSGVVVSGGDDATLQLWDEGGNSLRSPLVGHQNGMALNNRIYSSLTGRDQAENSTSDYQDISSVSITPDGRTIASGGSDGTVRVWELEDFPVIPPFEDQSRGQRICHTVKGKIIITTNSDNKNQQNIINLWDLDGRPVGKPLRLPNEPDDCYLSVEGETIITVSYNTIAINQDTEVESNTIQLWGLDGSAQSKPFSLLRSRMDFDFISLDIEQKVILVAQCNGEIELQDYELSSFSKSTNCLLQIESKRNVQLKQARLTPGSKTFISIDDQNRIQLWNYSEISIKNVYCKQLEHIRSINTTPDGYAIATVDQSHNLQIVLLRLGGIQQGIQETSLDVGDFGNVSYLILNPDLERILVLNQDNILKIIDYQGHLRSRPFRHEGSISALAFSPDGRAIATASQLGMNQGGGNTTFRLWDTEGNLMHKFEWRMALVNWEGFLTFSTSGKSLAAYSKYNNRLARWIGNWQSGLEVACNRLRYHPVFTNPESIEDLKQRETAIAACKTCEKHVWKKALNSVE